VKAKKEESWIFTFHTTGYCVLGFSWLFYSRCPEMNFSDIILYDQNRLLSTEDLTGSASYEGCLDFLLGEIQNCGSIAVVPNHGAAQKE